jgi:septal ring-binding cell division protein DamX
MALGLCAINLHSCVMNQQSVSTDYNRAYVLYTYDPSHSYPQPYYQNYQRYDYNTMPTQSVEVPESYHVNSLSAPVSFKDRDRTWVNSQNPGNYTIEIADDEQASQVAQKLYKAPKKDRMAQIKCKTNGKQHYKGLYGSYASQEDAEKALNDLPSDLKQGAGVKNWSHIQSNLEE